MSVTPPNSGEVHARRAGEPGAGQKVFRPGAAAEQSKHEGLVWSVHGKWRAATLESGKGRNVYGESKNTRRTFFFFFFRALRFVKVEASQGPCQCKTVLARCVRARV